MKQTIKLLSCGLLVLGAAQSVYAHGYVEKPGSRNYYCGAVTKPDHAFYGTPAYSECKEAFTSPTDGGMNNEGYQFMSILTHDKGAKEVRPLPQNVCGFDGETFGGKSTIWDMPIDWPTSEIKSGLNEFVWNISYGPHFSDTDQFRYWITKKNYKFEVGKPLSWNDLEPAPFCELEWTGESTDNLRADYTSQKFHMNCNVPAREGRHVIYGEWGRTPSTYERFHSCMDVEFAGGEVEEEQPPVEEGKVDAKFKIEPNVKEFSGPGVLVLNGTGSKGENLSYQWSVSSQNPALYSIDNADQSTAYLHLANPDAIGDVVITLSVSSGELRDDESQTIKHIPIVVTEWIDLGQLTHEAKTLKAGDKVSIRAVLENGQDVYYPEEALVLTAANAGAKEWTYALAQEVNKQNGDLMVGEQHNDKIHAVKHETANKMFAKDGAQISNAYLQIEESVVEEEEPGNTACIVTKQGGANAWWAGFNIATDAAKVSLDFANTGIDLSKVRIDSGNFQVTVKGSVLELVKPSWVNMKTTGYLGMNADNYAPLAGNAVPVCK